MGDESGSKVGIWRGMDCVRDNGGGLKGMRVKMRENGRVGVCLRYG